MIFALETEPANGLRHMIPWPCKSGRCGDLTAKSVKDFFTRAPPQACSPVTMFKLMGSESLKWHPDKIRRLLPDSERTDADEMIVNMICRVIIELRREAADKK